MQYHDSIFYETKIAHAMILALMNPFISPIGDLIGRYANFLAPISVEL